MALAEQAKRVAAEFDFPADNVRKAVKEFIREMGTFRGCARQSQTDEWLQTRDSRRTAPN
jgi:hypothetical protein